jgi:glycerol-3-phosphate acyltransferase PlsY
MKFKGGKGIASTLGLFWVGLSCESSWYVLIVFGILIGIILFIFSTEWGSLGSLLGVSCLAIVQLVVFLFRYLNVVNAYMVSIYMIILAIMLLTWCAHHKNIVRLFAGEEHHTSLKKLAKKK